MTRITEKLANVLCDVFGMDRENLIINVFDNLVDMSKEIYEIDEQIINLTSKLKSLKSNVTRKKNLFVKTLRLCKRNYPENLFSSFSESISSSITHMNDSYFVKSSTLSWLEKKIDSLMKCKKRPFNRVVERTTKVKNKMLGHGAILNQTPLSGDVPKCAAPFRHKEYPRSARTDSVAFHAWSKNRHGEIDVIIGSRIERIVKVYDPGFFPFPNPFSDYAEYSLTNFHR